MAEIGIHPGRKRSGLSMLWKTAPMGKWAQEAGKSWVGPIFPMPRKSLRDRLESRLDRRLFLQLSGAPDNP